MITGSFFAFIFHWGVEDVDHFQGMNKAYSRYAAIHNEYRLKNKADGQRSLAHYLLSEES